MLIYKVSHSVCRINLELIHSHISLLVVLHVSCLSPQLDMKLLETVPVLDLLESLKPSTVPARYSVHTAKCLQVLLKWRFPSSSRFIIISGKYFWNYTIQCWLRISAHTLLI